MNYAHILKISGDRVGHKTASNFKRITGVDLSLRPSHLHQLIAEAEGIAIAFVIALVVLTYGTNGLTRVFGASFCICCIALCICRSVRIRRSLDYRAMKVLVKHLGFGTHYDENSHKDTDDDTQLIRALLKARILVPLHKRTQRRRKVSDAGTSESFVAPEVTEVA